MKAVAGKSLCSAIVISIAVVLGLMHHKAATPPAAGEAEYGFAPVEVAGHSGGPAVLDLAGTKLNIHRQDFGRNLKETRKELSARARRDGWEEIDIEQAMGQLPSGAVAGGNLEAVFGVLLHTDDRNARPTIIGLPDRIDYQAAIGSDE